MVQSWNLWVVQICGNSFLALFARLVPWKRAEHERLVAADGFSIIRDHFVKRIHHQTGDHGGLLADPKGFQIRRCLQTPFSICRGGPEAVVYISLPASAPIRGGSCRAGSDFRILELLSRLEGPLSWGLCRIEEANGKVGS